MRKGKRFTPKLLDKWEFDQRRGQGIYGDYKPWHQNTRSDPASMGRAHVTFCPRTGRLRHHLSDGEQLIFGFALMTPHVIDIREQFKLELSSHYSALHEYSINHAEFITQGSLEVAAELGIRHPSVSGGGDKGCWRLSTDFLLTVKELDGSLALIAVAYKTLEDLNSPRKRNLLRIEQVYWQKEGVSWLLISPRQYSRAVASTIRSVLPWVISRDQASDAMKLECTEIAKSHEGKPLRDVLMAISDALGIDPSQANKPFYQAVWSGMLPLDLARSRLLGDPMQFLTMDDFLRQNPIISRRSVCL